ncbi:hypothetical protein BaRGS_00013160 [Batillaria attramentaria]|uniref:Uncharacterized protein n=1 Tax=Batillaria attramentaria TaxID=370345 RepID=A0ABD0L896_9CAEN
MKVLPPGADISTVDKGVKNEWKWGWLQDRTAMGGKKALLFHAEDADHRRNLKSIRQSTKLDGASTTTVTQDGMGDRKAELKAVVCAFIAEHCLPFSLGEILLSLPRVARKDIVTRLCEWGDLDFRVHCLCCYVSAESARVTKVILPASSLKSTLESRQRRVPFFAKVKEIHPAGDMRLDYLKQRGESNPFVWADEAWLPADHPLRPIDAPQLAPGRGIAFILFCPNLGSCKVFRVHVTRLMCNT